MNTIAIINQKGGVGKSTTALSIGTGLAGKGYRVLLVDLDPQCNLSLTMGASLTESHIFDTLKNPELNPIGESIQHGEKCDIVAGDHALSLADQVLVSTKGAEGAEEGMERMFRLRRALAGLPDKYDYCIVDTPPALGTLTMNALTACNGALIPAQADIYSLQGIAELADTINVVKQFCNPSLQVMGILLTRFNARTIIRREIAGMIEEMSGRLESKLYSTRIRECTAVVEAQAMNKSIFDYAPRSNAGKDYSAFIEEFIGNR